MASGSTVSLRLVIDTKGNRVMYAEAGKDFVDFLFNVLSFPVGAVVSLLKEDTVGCLGDLYESLGKLSDACMEPTTKKDVLLKPVLCSYAPSSSLLLPSMESHANSLYRCGNCSYRGHVAHDPKTLCGYCGRPMSERQNFAKSTDTEGGFVKEGTIYMVMDNLEVKLMSTDSMFGLLNKFNIEAVGAVEGRNIQIGPNEGVKLLKICLQSKTVLTDLFLEKKVEKCDVTNPLSG